MQATALGLLLFGLVAFFTTIDYTKGQPVNELFWVGIVLIVVGVVLLWIVAIKAIVGVYRQWRRCAPARICARSGHIWRGCVCARCGEKRDEGHTWDGCICVKCGATRHEWDGCTCTKCGEIRDEGHEQVGCVCIKCGAELHTWYGCECVACGKFRDEEHDYDARGVCRICGAEKPYCPYYNPGDSSGSVYIPPCSDNCTVKDKYRCLI